jgi:hypothetical protein
MAALQRNWTFADSAKKVMGGESGHSQLAIADLGKVPAERLHRKAADSHCRPIVDVRFGAFDTAQSTLQISQKISKLP